MEVPKFKQYINEDRNIDRKNKSITVAILTIADSDNPKKDTTVELVEKACSKKRLSV